LGQRAFFICKKEHSGVLKKTEERRFDMFIFLLCNWPLRGQDIFTKKQKG